MAVFKDGVTRVSSMAAAWFLANHTGTPFWPLLNVILESHNCKVSAKAFESRSVKTIFLNLNFFLQVHYRPECSGFNEGEESITIEYTHNEL